MNELGTIFDDIRKLDTATVEAAEPRAQATATDELVDTVLAKLVPDVQRQWLGNAAPVVFDLLDKAQDGSLPDSELIDAAERIGQSMPDLFDQLDWRALGEAIALASGTAVVNGALAREQEFEQAGGS